MERGERRAARLARRGGRGVKKRAPPIRSENFVLTILKKIFGSTKNKPNDPRTTQGYYFHVPIDEAPEYYKAMKENILSYIFQITFLLQYYERTKERNEKKMGNNVPKRR